MRPAVQLQTHTTPTAPFARPAKSVSSDESGSAYIIALLVLVVLSILGLTLALIGQTELRIGANELTAHRALYNAENGVSLGLARKLLVNSTSEESDAEDTYKMRFVIPEPKNAADGSNIDPASLPSAVSKFGEAVEVSPFFRVQEVPCDLCSANVGGTKLVSATYALVSRSDRIVWDGPARFNIKPFVPGAGGSSEVNPDWDKVQNATHLATKQVYAMKGIQPWWPSRPEARNEELQAVAQEVLGGGQ
jgi:hypothetical protein